MLYDQNEVLAPMMAQPMVFAPDNTGAINASRVTELRTTEFVYPQIMQVQDKKIIDFEEQK